MIYTQLYLVAFRSFQHITIFRRIYKTITQFFLFENKVTSLFAKPDTVRSPGL